MVVHAHSERTDGLHHTFHRHLPASHAGYGEGVRRKCGVYHHRISYRFCHRTTDMGTYQRSHRQEKPLYAGMATFTIGSIGCAMSDSITEIVIWRVFQATGACIGPMLSRSMVRDLYNRTEAARMLSALMTILALAPIIAPLAGGFLQDIWSWRAIFWLMTALSAMLFVAVFFLPETLPKEKEPTTPSSANLCAICVLSKTSLIWHIR